MALGAAQQHGYVVDKALVGSYLQRMGEDGQRSGPFIHMALHDANVARTIPAVTVSLLTVGISIGAQNATIRQETSQTIDWEDHHHVIMALQCGTPSVPLGLDQPPSLNVANKARSVFPRNVAWWHQGVQLVHKVTAL